MLKFLDDKQSSRRPLVRYQPQLVYGHTIESPSEFLNNHTIYYQKNHTQNKLSNSRKSQGKISQGHRIKILKTAASKQYKQFNINRQYQRPQSKELETRRKSEFLCGQFNLTKGQFTNFLDKHKHYNNIGVIYKQKEVENKTQNALPKSSTQKNIWNKSINTESKSIANSIFKSKFSLHNDGVDENEPSENPKYRTWLTKSSSVSIFEKPIHKSQIKLRRKDYLEGIMRQTQQKLETKYSTFQLPRLGVSHQLFFLHDKQYKKKQIKSEMDEVNLDINKFQKTLNIKFK